MPDLAAAQDSFNLEDVQSTYSTRDYACAPMPERGDDYYQIAENAWFAHDDFANMVFFVTDDGVVVYDPKSHSKAWRHHRRHIRRHSQGQL